ncbi:MAG: ABC transporter substrate-binding protein [Pseudomonadota bacterium]|nr:ABC transporter substrate-binding protein [Pseudomonadota bacterium]
MPFRKNFKASPNRRYGLFALGWLIIISLLQYHFDSHREDRIVIRMGYMPVITNLAAPLLDQASKEGGDYRFIAVKFTSFAEMAEALRNDHIDAAFMIAPLAIVLKQQGEKVKIVYIGNRHESTLVVRKELSITRIEDLAGKTLAVPMRYSGHYLETMRLMEAGLITPAIKIVEMNPSDMASALASGALDAYFVGEPFAAQTILSKDAEVLHYVEELCPHFICNLVLVKQELINRNAQAIQHLVSAAARSGIWAGKHPLETAQIASLYWNQSQELIYFALTTPKLRIEYDRFIPDSKEIQKLATMMVKYKLLEHNDIKGLVNDNFAKSANLNGITDLKSILDHR